MSLVFNTKALEIVRREVQKSGWVIENATSLKIRCPFHQDATPSCFVNVSNPKFPAGFFNCFGCPEKGPWNKLADKMGWERITDHQQKEISEIAPNVAYLMGDLKKDMLGDEETDWATLDEGIKDGMLFDIEDDWRDIPKKLLIDLGAKRFLSKRSPEPMIILPVTVNSETIGLIKARVIKSKIKGASNYINSSGKNWVLSKGLFCIDLAMKLPAYKKYKMIYLVEGPRDALKLISMGIPAAGFMGTNNWTDNKGRVLVAMGVRYAVILCDNDKPGRIAAKNIKASLKSLRGIRALRIKLPRKEDVGELDPASMKPKMVKQLHKAVIAKLGL